MSFALQGTADLDAPFPGLRAFEAEESLLFYGREAHVADLLNRLGDNRFIAVTGTSGSGKSSLVRAGLRPALQRGYLLDSTSRWRFATMRPGSAPIEALARAVAGALDGLVLEDVTRTMRATSAGLSQVVAGAKLAPGESLLVIADQFEELFRFDLTRDQQADAALFVSSLLDATERRDPRIYVVVTMRSEFLGRCSEFTGLAEAFNRSQYLVPRLTRDERREAVERPLRLFDTSASPALVQQVLNDAGDDPDQLPVLQHVLLRTYRKWQQSGGTGRLEREHYDAIGGIEQALDRHGNEILEDLPEPSQRMAERLFRSLTVNQGGIALRRPRRLGQLYGIVGIDEPEDKPQLDFLIKKFASKEHSFLRLSSASLTPDTVVDITHESLIRKWKRLGLWVREETRSAEWYADLSRDVVRYRQHEVGPWEDPELAGVQQRRRGEGWNEAWGNQYRRPDDPSFHDVLSFLDESTRIQDERRREEEEQRNRELQQAQALTRARRRLAMVLAFLAVGVVGTIAVILYLQARSQRQMAEMSKTYAAAAEKSAADQARLSALLSEQADLLTARPAPPSGSGGTTEDPRLAQLTKEIEQIRLQAKGSEDRLAKLKTAQAAGASDQSSLQGRIETLQQQLSQASGDRDKLQAQVNTLQSQLASANAERDKLQKEVTSLQTATKPDDRAQALQKQLDEERARSKESATEIARLNTEIATLRTGRGTSTTADIEKAYTDGVRAYDLGNWKVAAQSMRDAIRMQSSAQPPNEIRPSGTRRVPYAPQSYLGAALYEMKADCATVAPVLNSADAEPKAPDVQGRLQAARKQCQGQ